jgi:hypothetical protein
MYKDKVKQMEANRIASQRRREKQKGMTQGMTETGGMTQENPVTPSPADGWTDVKAYISREAPNMPNLERLQRIAGSLGKNAGEVMFGVTGLTMEDIGSVIGTMEGKYAL